MKVVYTPDMDAMRKENILIPEDFFKEYGIPYELDEYGTAIQMSGDKTDYNTDQRLAKFVEEHGEYDSYVDEYEMSVRDAEDKWVADLCVKEVPRGCYYRISCELDSECDYKMETLDIFDPINPDGWTLAE